jgi:hypothetical protein
MTKPEPEEEGKEVRVRGSESVGLENEEIIGASRIGAETLWGNRVGGRSKG